MILMMIMALIFLLMYVSKMSFTIRRRVKAKVLSLQEQVNLPEGRPFVFVTLPTLGHEITDLPRTTERRREHNGLAAISPHV